MFLFSFSVSCVLGNKIDLNESRQVSVAEGEEFAASIGAQHFETSALSNIGEWSKIDWSKLPL